MSDWIKSRLGNEVDLLMGFPFASNGYSRGGIRLLRGDNIVQGRLRWDGVKYWPSETSANHQRYLLQADDVVLAMDRPWIEAGLKYAAITFADLPALLVQRVARLRGGPGLDTRFLRYLIGSPAFTDHVLAVQTGTAVPHISGRQILEYQFDRPPLDEQRAIAGVLGALDDKIELNRRMNETLDRLAELHFGRLEANASPEWIDGSIADLADYVNGRNFTKDATGRGRMVIRIAELNSGPGGSTVFTEADAPDVHVAREGDILFAWSGSLGVHRWRDADALVNQHIFKVIPKAPPWFVYRHLRRAMPRFREIAADKATTMGHIKRSHLSDVKLKLPPSETMRITSALIEPLDDRVAANERESRTLAELRDALVPKLISGELRVRDAEAAVEQST